MIDHRTILEQVGYPTNVLTLDFESYFDTEYNMSKMSTIEYINDIRFELTGLSWGRAEGIEFFCPSDAGVESLWMGHIGYALKNFKYWDDVTVLVQNARFDITVLQEKFDIIPKYIIDLKDLASHYDSRMSHKLKDMAKMFKLNAKGETTQFKGLHWDRMDAGQRADLKEYCINDVELEIELFKILLPKLTCPKTELQLARHTLDLWLHQRLEVDFEKARQLRVSMRSKIASAIAASGHTPKELRSAKFARYLQDAMPEGETIPMKKGKKGNIAAIAKADEECQQLMVHPKKEVRDLITARLAVKSWPTHIRRVSSIISQAKANGGLIRVPLNYYGGHTGRYSGGEGYNLQNFGTEGRDGQINDPLIQQIGTILSPPDGYVANTCDSAQIEARILAWLAGQQDLLDGFANGEDVYSQFASKLFRCTVRKERKTDPKPIRLSMKIKRGFGKSNILGNGYGMGADRAYAKCLANPELRPLFESGEYTYATIKGFIDTYRTTYAKIPAYWTAVERAFKQCIRFPHLEPKVGLVTFRCKGTTVEIELPSGRVLYYRHCKIDAKGTIKWQHGALWGGGITENIDQAIARDLLGFWILECEKAGVPIALHIHDDTRIIVPKDEAKELIKKQETIMKSVPDWAAGLPVDVESKSVLL